MSLTTRPPPSPSGVGVSTYYRTGSYSAGDLNVPSLVTFFTPGSDCLGRWLMPWPTDPTFTVFSTSPTDTRTGYFYDPSYLSCQPYSSAQWYSPGVCPSGYAIAALHENHFRDSASSLTYWDAACCPSGMSAGGGGRSTCYSSFTSPLLAYAPFTVTKSTSESSITRAYWWVTYSRVGDASTGSYSTATLSNATLVPSGIARADAINVAWEVTDLSKFPPAYAASLAKQIGVSFTPTGLPVNPADFTTSPAPGTTSNLPGPTNSPDSSDSSGLSTGAKAGIGVGAVAAVAAIVGFGILALCLRRRRKYPAVQTPGNDLPEMIVDESGASKTTVNDEARGSWSRSQS